MVLESCNNTHIERRNAPSNEGRASDDTSQTPRSPPAMRGRAAGGKGRSARQFFVNLYAPRMLKV